QAEDGIRDRTVTGVQTCALPICLRYFQDSKKWQCDHLMPDFNPKAERGNRGQNRDAGLSFHRREQSAGKTKTMEKPEAECNDERSEERRVGKECRAR